VPILKTTIYLYPPSHEFNKIARKMKNTGFVENIKPYDVRIVCEGSEENIYSFIEKLNIKKFPVDVFRLEMTKFAERNNSTY